MHRPDVEYAFTSLRMAAGVLLLGASSLGAPYEDALCLPVQPGATEVSCSGAVVATQSGGSVVIQDGTAAVVLSDPGKKTGVFSLQRGDRVEARGELQRTRHRGWRLAITSLNRLGTAEEPGPYDLMARDLLGGNYDHLLVRLSGAIVSSGSKDNPRLVIRDRTGDIALDLNNRTLVNDAVLARLATRPQVDISGIVHYRADDNAQLIPVLRPRDPADFTFRPQTSYWDILAGSAMTALLAGVLYAGVWFRAARRNTSKLTGLTQELRSSESALRRSEALYRSVIESSTDAIITVDVGCRIAFANKSTEVLFGWTVEELHGQTLRSKIAGCSAKCGDGCGLVGRQFETTAVRKDGRTIDVEVSASAMAEDGHEARVTIRDITARKHAENEIQCMNGALRRLTGELLRSQDVERRRIARELHDGAVQYLAAAKMNITLAQDAGPPPERFQRPLLANALSLVDECIREIRSVSYLLHPPMLEDLGLRSALRMYLNGFTERTGIEVTFEEPQTELRLPGEAELAFFRIVQEALSNVHRHSSSAAAQVRLSWNGSQAELEVRDFGKGLLDTRQLKPGVGLLGMRERARQLGGDCEIRSDSSGTTVLIRLPLDGEIGQIDVSRDDAPTETRLAS